VGSRFFFGNQYCGEKSKLKVAILERGADVLQKSAFQVEDVVMLRMPVLNP
jgi:hypothetical protein